MQGEAVAAWKGTGQPGLAPELCHGTLCLPWTLGEGRTPVRPCGTGLGLALLPSTELPAVPGLSAALNQQFLQACGTGSVRMALLLPGQLWASKAWGALPRQGGAALGHAAQQGPLPILTAGRVSAAGAVRAHRHRLLEAALHPGGRCRGDPPLCGCPGAGWRGPRVPPASTLALVVVPAFRLPALPALPSSQPLSSLLQITFFTLLSVLGVMLSLAGSILSCQNAQLVKSLEACERVRLDKAERPWHSESSLAAGLRGRGELVAGFSGGSWERARGLEVPHGVPRPQEKDSCICCQTYLEHAPASCSQQSEMLTMFPNPDCRSIRVALKVGEGSLESSCAPLQALWASIACPAPPQDLLFSVCGLTVFSTIICTLSAVVCCIQIFSLDIVHVVRPSPDPGGHGTGQHPQAGWATRGPGQDLAEGPCGDQEGQDVRSCRISGQGASAPYASSSLFPLPAAGPPALQLRDTGMHVAPRHLSAEHAGLRGVRASGATPPILPT